MGAATTHWAFSDVLAARETIDVRSDQIYVHDRDRWTSAGVTAGIDLSLALVEADHGHDVAHQVAARDTLTDLVNLQTGTPWLPRTYNSRFVPNSP